MLEGSRAGVASEVPPLPGKHEPTHADYCVWRAMLYCQGKRRGSYLEQTECTCTVVT